MDSQIEHPHQEKDCQICWLIDNAIRPVIEFQVRKQVAENILLEYDGDDREVWLADILSRCADIARGREQNG